MKVRATSSYIQISHQLTMGIVICTLVVIATCILWSSNALALNLNQGSSDCTTATQAVINFFVHDDLGVRPTGSAFFVVNPLTSPNGVTNTNLFGSIAVLDDKVTVGPNVSSTEIARGRGFYVFDHLATDSTSLEFVLTTIFNNQSGYDDGSTLVLRGYDNIDEVYRELAIIGGTGTFRLARGWVGILTTSLNGGAAVLNMTAHVYYGCDGGATSSIRSASSQMIPSYLTILNVGICTILLKVLSPLVSIGHQL